MTDAFYDQCQRRENVTRHDVYGREITELKIQYFQGLATKWERSLRGA